MRVALGTAQFGLHHGIANRLGRVPPSEVRAILATAAERGVVLLDTAAAYGLAERVLGELLPRNHGFRIVTKLPRLPAAIPAGSVDRWARGVLTESLRHLRCECVDGLLMHAAQDLLGSHGEELYTVLREVRDEGRAVRIGVSVDSGDEIDGLLERYDLDLMQLPMSALDQRLVATGRLTRLKRRNVEVRGRSLLLQGLLLMNPADLPAPYFDSARPRMTAFQEAAARVGLTPLAAAVAFGQEIPEIECAVFGVTTAAELDEILDAAEKRAALPPEWYQPFELQDEAILNPSRWPERAA